MNKILTRVLCLVTAVMPLTILAQQLPDPHFEDWTGATFDDSIQNEYWHASNVEMTALGMLFKFNFAHREVGRSGYCIMAQSQSVGVAGITETYPGYYSLGSGWQYYEGLSGNMTRGTKGGISFSYRPDSLSVWVKRTGSNTDKEDFHILFYSWTGTAEGSSYKSKNGGCMNVAVEDEESDIRIALDGNECQTTTEGGQVAEGWWRERATYSEWTNIRIPIYYMSDSVPTKCNVILSASNYPNFGANSGFYDGNSLYVDDIELIYSSKIQTLYINGKEWKDFDPKNTDVQTYIVPSETVAIPNIEAYRGAGSLTNSQGKTVEFSGRKLSEAEVIIKHGDFDTIPTLITVLSQDGQSSFTYKIQFRKEHSLTFVCDSVQGSVEVDTIHYNYPYITFSAVPNYGYYFTQWGDGNTDNPRTIVLVSDTAFTAEFAVAKSGSCGDNLALTWTYDDVNKVLTISGNGSLMSNYTYGIEAPGNAEKLVIESGVTEIHTKKAFTNCSHITFVSLYSNAVVAKQYSSTSSNMGSMFGSQLREVIIGDSVTAIGKYAFCSASNLTSVKIGSNVASIGNYAFKNCSSLTSIICLGVTPPSLGEDKNTIPSWTGIYVPCGSEDAYKSVWSRYASQIQQQFFAFSLRGVASNPEMGYVEVPTKSCEDTIITAIPNYGCHFVQWNDSVTDNPRKIELTQDTTFVAVFARNPVITYVYDTVYGYVSGNTTTPAGIVADTITFEAIPNYGYHFVQWSDGVADNPRTIYLDKDTTFAAAFAPNIYTISVTCDSVYGTIEGESGSFEYMSEHTYKAVPKYGYHFVQWNTDGTTDAPTQNVEFLLPSQAASMVRMGEPMYSSETLYIVRGYVTEENVYGYSKTWRLSDDPYGNDSLIIYKPTNAPQVGDYVEVEGNLSMIGHVWCPGIAFGSLQVLSSSDPGSPIYTQNPITIVLKNDLTMSAVFAPNTYTINDGSNNNEGYISGVGLFDYLTQHTLTAIPNHGYHFVQWSDGITENQRTVTLTQDTTFTAIFAQTFAGQCGDSLYWAFSNDSLVFSGDGTMYNYVPENLPWSLLIGQTKYIEFAPEMTSISAYAFQNMVNMRKLNLSSKIVTIGDHAFANCTSLDNVTIPNSVTALGESAFRSCAKIDTLIIGTGLKTITNQFRGCTDLHYLQLGQSITNIGYGSFYDARQLTYIVCLPVNPPFAYPDEVGKERSFYNMNAQVLIPCDNFEAYKHDALWGSFDLKCLSSNSGTAVDGQVTVIPGDDNATFTWPTDGSADTYNLQITKDGEIFCTLTFNSQGQLLGIAFAPSRTGEPRQMPSATLTTKGMTFQVTGLDYASQYRFSFETKDNTTQTIFAYTGGFHTNGTEATPEGLDNISSKGPAPRKVMIDGQIFILRGEKVYTTTGQEVR